jgi:hypothetical protein
MYTRPGDKDTNTRKSLQLLYSTPQLGRVRVRVDIKKTMIGLEYDSRTSQVNHTKPLTKNSMNFQIEQ